MKTYTVKYERDSAGWWVASVREVRGCHTQGRSIAQARERIREALGLWVRGAARARLVDDVRLPADVRRLLNEQRAARERAETEQRKAQETVRRTARRLTAGMHLSVRDAGELLGLSHQRIQQLIAG